MVSQENYFLLRLAISNIDRLSFIPTDNDWRIFYDFCKQQALLGIGFATVEKLHEQGIECPMGLRMQWLAATLRIEERNKLMNLQCKELTERLEHDGLSCCILKGQGNLLNYPEHLRLRRNPGDIDIWCDAPEEGLPIPVQTGRERIEYETYHGRRAIIEYVRMLHRMAGNKKCPHMRYHHIDAPNIGSTPIEAHFRPAFCHAFLRNVNMQRWFDKQADVCMKNKNHLGFAAPTSSVNVVYQMTHLFCHYFEEGIGLRQLLDYYFVLKTWYNDYMEKKDFQSLGMWIEGLGVSVMSKEEVMSVLRSFGMSKFAAAVMWVLHEVFAMPTPYYICEPNEKEGRKLLAEIMQGGNFGQYDERGKNMKNGGTIPHAIWKMKRVMRLVSSYPEEALCEPFFRVWHFFWRIIH